MKKIVYGTQYYRSPTPLPNEWEGDLSAMGEYGLNIIQIRINWRNNERKENVYDFSDVDALMDLAEKHNKKVIIKFLLECAPQYIYDKYNGTRIGPRGERLRGGYHGAFFGGWLPCFTNPKIQERASKFVSKVIERYKDRKSIILYNAWNEIRNRPMEECFCDECKKDYQNYLKDKFKTIENLNSFYGASEESFETIDFPSTPHGVWDTYEFKKYRSEYANYKKVRMVYDAIKKIDNTRPVMCHIGFTSGFQDNIGDACNDFYVSKAVDFWGTSIPFDQHMDTFNNRCDMQLLNDFIRGVCPDYFVHEVYPSLGMFHLYDTPYELKYKLLKILSRGAKGLCFWQYRSERVGHEMDCSGLTYMNGKPRDVLKSVKEVGDFIESHNDLLANMTAKKSDIAILYDYNSQLLSEIEDTFGPDYKFDLYNPIFYYKKAHQGLYRLITKSNYSVDYINTYNLEELKKYKVVFVPYLSLLTKEISTALEEYVSSGGTLVLDEGFGLRQENTWVEPYNINTKMFSSWMETRLKEDAEIIYNGEKIKVGPYNTIYRTKDAKTIATFDNGEPAIQAVNYGKGTIYQLGFSFGYKCYEEQDKSFKDLLNVFLFNKNINTKKYSSIDEGIEVNELENDTDKLIFIFNTSDKQKQIQIVDDVKEYWGDGKISNNSLSLSPKSFGILYIKR